MDQLFPFLANHPMLTAAWIGIFIAILVVSIRIKLSPVKQLSPQELTFVVNKQEGVIVDIRNDADFKKSRIVDSIHVSNDKINKNDLATLEKHKDKPIIVVCVAGISAASAADKLVKAGFSNVNLLKGGMNAWVNAGLPVVKK